MALIKKVDVERHFAARRAMRLGRIGLMSQPIAAGAVPAAKRKRVPALGDTLTQETFSPSVPATSIPIVAGSGRNQLLRPPGIRQE
jgi:hypothetical protein